MTNNPSENTLDKFTKTSKIGPSMEILIAEFLEFRVASYEFVFNWRHLRVSLNLLNLQWSFSAEV